MSEMNTESLVRSSGRSISMTELLWRGVRRKCPECGEGASFKGYLTQRDTCDCCGEELGKIRTDDGPAWLTILLVGHIVGFMMVEAYFNLGIDPSTGGILWPALALVMTAIMLPLVKGLWLALVWRLKAPGSGAD